jgi:D-alanyl-D-alanine carboxypeptidase/D-alanyl-D-alanine-endopeptidase (penicillin-binding protein 4)
VAVVEAVWAQALADAGITWSKVPAVRAVATGERRILAEIASAPFDSIAHEVNARSVNIGAELLLLWGGGADRAASRLEAHVRAVTGLDHGIRLVDGSGLSDDDRVSAGVFARYLARFPQTPAGRDFPLLFPANGSGTLRRLATGLPEAGVVRAKTGTLANVSTLVGYLGRSEGMLIVAALYNGPRAGDARLAQWELFRTLGADGVVIPAEPDVVAETFGGP